jgi:hypothetical protein
MADLLVTSTYPSYKRRQMGVQGGIENGVSGVGIHICFVLLCVKGRGKGV